MTPAKVAVIGTAPHGFAGAGNIHGQVAGLLAGAGYEVTFVAWERPYRADEIAAAGVDIQVPEVVSDAFPRSDALRTLVVVREIVSRARARAAAGKHVVLMGTYLFPFYQAVEKATELLAAEGTRVTSIAIPAGSDIWQIAVQVPELARALLRSHHTHLKVTYSRAFAEEITGWVGECGAFEIVPPPVDVQAFRPVSLDEKRSIRRRLGISEDALVLLNCSNMRPIKGLGETIRIAREFAGACPREVTLLLVGPVTGFLRECLELAPEAAIECPLEFRTGPLVVRLVGLQSRTCDYHAAADVALNTSYHDSFNLSLAESLASGTPIVSSDVVGIREIVEDLQVGHFFAYSRDAGAGRPGANHPLTPARSEPIVRALNDITAETNLVRMGANARRAVLRHLASDRILERWEALIRRSSPHEQGT
jgi:glycosyltransferase involved in cell wall biosynthesis